MVGWELVTPQIAEYIRVLILIMANLAKQEGSLYKVDVRGEIDSK